MSGNEFEEYFEVGNLLLSQGTAGSFFEEGDRTLIDSFVASIENYRLEHGAPLDQTGVEAEREFAFSQLPPENPGAEAVIVSWLALSTKIFFAGTDGENTPFSGF